ncbi:MFS transporter [Herbaspirillum lusitanum]|uniref:MFS transporter n=1 Tax=Herbaspirillum lusitanum TaxID=213312 RepID=A0ABW9AAE9_9BURK
MSTSIQPNEAALSALYSKINWRLLPFLLLCYIFAYLDRVNIGFAKLQMQSDLGLSDAAYGLGAGIFFIGYAMFEIPSNLMLPKVGASKTISRIMILWGLTSASMLFVQTETSFYCLRFLLGVFEAGFAPGMIFYLTYWYPQRRMARVMSIVMLAAPLAGIFCAPLSTWIMGAFADLHGLKGWQWMFLIEGLPCVLLGLLCLKVLSDRPQDAGWLSDEEKRLLASDVTPVSTKHHSFRQVATDPKVYLMAFGYFCLISGIYAVSFWLPTIIKDSGVTNLVHIGFYSAIPYVVAAICMLIFSWSSDHFRERRWHSAVPAFVAAVMLVAATMNSGNLWPALFCMTIATAMMWVAYTVFWAIPSEYLKGEASAGGIALINTIGLLGGFLSPTLIGWIRTATGNTQSGLWVMVGLLVVGFVLLALNRQPAAAQAAY